MSFKELFKFVDCVRWSHQNGTGLCTLCYVKGLREWCYNKLVGVETRIDIILQVCHLTVASVSLGMIVEPSLVTNSVCRHDSGTQLGYQQWL